MDVIDILMAKMLSGGGDPEAIASAVTDWLEENVDPVGSAVVVDSSLSIEGAAADAKATGDAIRAIGSGLTDEAKQALLACFENIAWVNDDGQTYYDALEDALYPPAPPANLVSISASFNPGSHVVYDTDTLDSLKPYLTVTARYDNSTTQTVTGYTLSGTLTAGTSTITVSYTSGSITKTTTFTVTVTEYVPTANYVAVGNPTIQNGILTVENGKFIRSTVALSPSSGQAWKIRTKIKFNSVAAYPTFVNILGGCSSDGSFAKTFVSQNTLDTLSIFTLYVSADKSTWNVTNQMLSFQPPINASDDKWYYYEIGYDGSAFFGNIYENSWSSTPLGSFSYPSNVTIYNGEYVGFGVPSTVSGFDGQIDLSECKMYIGDSVVWQALS